MKRFPRSSTPFPLVFCLTASPFPPVSLSLGLIWVLAADVAGVGAWSSQTLWSGSLSGPSPWEEGEVPEEYGGVLRPPSRMQARAGDKAALLQAVAHRHLSLSLCVARETGSWRDCHQVSDELIIIFLISCLKSASRNGCLYVHSSHIDLWCCEQGWLLRSHGSCCRVLAPHLENDSMELMQSSHCNNHLNLVRL